MTRRSLCLLFDIFARCASRLRGRAEEPARMKILSDSGQILLQMQSGTANPIGMALAHVNLRKTPTRLPDVVEMVSTADKRIA